MVKGKKYKQLASKRKTDTLHNIEKKYKKKKQTPDFDILRFRAHNIVRNNLKIYADPRGLGLLANKLRCTKTKVLTFFSEKEIKELGWIREETIEKPKKKVYASQLKAEMEAAKKRGLLK